MRCTGVPHRVSHRVLKGAIHLTCATCGEWVYAMFLPEDDPAHVLYVLTDQARQLLSPYEGFDMTAALGDLLAMYSNAHLEATGESFDAAGARAGQPFPHWRAQVWRWDDDETPIAPEDGKRRP